MFPRTRWPIMFYVSAYAAAQAAWSMNDAVLVFWTIVGAFTWAATPKPS